MPPLPGWRERSVFIGKKGQISFYHYDFTAQALSKLSRGYDRDINDVQSMFEQGLFSLANLLGCFEAIEGAELIFPGLKDLYNGKADTVGALLVAITATRLTAAGLYVPKDHLALYARLQAERDDAYPYYNALLNRLNSFCNALELSYRYEQSQ